MMVTGAVDFLSCYLERVKLVNIGDFDIDEIYPYGDPMASSSIAKQRYFFLNMYIRCFGDAAPTDNVKYHDKSNFIHIHRSLFSMSFDGFDTFNDFDTFDAVDTFDTIESIESIDIIENIESYRIHRKKGIDG